MVAIYRPLGSGAQRPLYAGQLHAQYLFYSSRFYNIGIAYPHDKLRKCAQKGLSAFSKVKSYTWGHLRLQSSKWYEVQILIVSSGSLHPITDSRAGSMRQAWTPAKAQNTVSL